MITGQSTSQINKHIRAIRIDDIKNPYLHFVLSIPEQIAALEEKNIHGVMSKSLIAVINTVVRSLEVNLAFLAKHNLIFKQMLYSERLRLFKAYNLSKTDLDDMMKVPQTAVYEIFKLAARELIKNAIDAGATTIEIGFLCVNQDIICFVVDNGIKGFTTLKKGELTDYLAMVGEDTHEIKSEKTRGNSCGGSGLALIQLAKTMRLCNGHLYVGSNLSMGATILLVASQDARLPKNLFEIQAEFSSTFNTDTNQSSITKTVTSGLPALKISRQSSITNSGSTSFLSSLWSAFIGLFRTSQPPSPSTKTLLSEASMDEGKEIKSPPRFRFPNYRSIQENFLTDDEGRIRTIINYHFMEVYELNENGVLQRKIIYSSKGNPRKMHTYHTNRPTGRDTYDISMGNARSRPIEYRTGQLRSYSIFNSDGSTRLRQCYDENGRQTESIKSNHNRLCTIL